MTIFFQMMGMTGVVMVIFGLLGYAVTQLTDWFFWILEGGGVGMILLFVLTSLTQKKQAALGIAALVAAPWFVALTKYRVAIDAFVGEKPAVGFSALLGALAVTGIIIYFLRPFLRALFEGRAARYGTTGAIYGLIMLAVLGVLNIMSNKDFHVQKDFTENKVYTLTEQSEKILKNLKTPLKITAFFDDRNETKEAARELLGLYRSKSAKVELTFVDPDREREVAVAHNAKDGDILVELGGQGNTTKELTEQGITQAILKVTRSSTPQVCFTKGHGEEDLEAAEDDPRSLSVAKKAIESEGYSAKAVEGIAGGVPSECSVLAVAGPIQRFTADEAAAVDAFLQGGGRAILMLDPNIPDPRLATKDFGVQDTGLEAVLTKWGVDLGRNFILEKHIQLLAGVRTELRVISMKYGDHPIVEPLKGRQTVFENVRSVRKAGGTGTGVELIFSADGDASWAETEVGKLFRERRAEIDAKDLRGPVPIAVAVEKDIAEGKQAKLIVFGDSDFASNGGVRTYEFNFDLFLNSLNWLQGEIEQISIRPKQMRTSAIELTPKQSIAIFYVAIVGLPMLVLIFGLDLWWFRRRRG